jgi:hypothetical protein
MLSSKVLQPTYAKTNSTSTYSISGHRGNWWHAEWQTGRWGLAATWDLRTPSQLVKQSNNGSDLMEMQDQYHLSPAHKKSLIPKPPQRLLKIFVKFSLNYLPGICHVFFEGIGICYVAVAFSKVRITGKNLLIFCNVHIIIMNLQKSDTKFVTIFRVTKS